MLKAFPAPQLPATRALTVTNVGSHRARANSVVLGRPVERNLPRSDTNLAFLVSVGMLPKQPAEEGTRCARS